VAVGRQLVDVATLGHDIGIVPIREGTHVAVFGLGSGGVRERPLKLYLPLTVTEVA